MAEPTIFDYVVATPAILVAIAAAVVFAVGVLLAGIRAPRWLRVRRQLAEMAEAARAENERLAVEALLVARLTEAAES